MKITAEIELFERQLRAVGVRERAEGGKRYLKSRFDFLGVPVPVLRRHVSDWLAAHPDLGSRDLVRLCRALFRRRIHELKAVAILLLQQRVDLLEAGDIDILEQMLRRSYTWAYVDALAVHVVGPLVERCPELESRLDTWARDGDFWIRRAAVLALLVPLRRGRGDWPRFVRFAESMLGDGEFFIQKAIGWVLRERSKVDSPGVEAFVEGNIGRISRVTLREAVKYIDPGARETFLASYRSRGKAG